MSIDASPAILGVLEEVGKRWLALTVLDRQTREHRSSTVEEQSSNHAALTALLDQTLLTMPEFAAAARFGTGEHEHGADPTIPARPRLTVIHQICGVMALLNGVGAVQELVNRCFPTIWTQHAQRSTARTDWRTVLISIAPQTVLEYATEGPDHARQHIATVTDRRGRSATGTAGSKKAAAQLASEHFIRLYYPAAVDRMRSTTSTSARPPLPLPRELTSHWRAIDDARLEFGLSDGAAGAWRLMATKLRMATIALPGARQHIEAQQSPETTQALEQHDLVKGQFEGLAGVCNQLATSCDSYADAVDNTCRVRRRLCRTRAVVRPIGSSRRKPKR
ncbi:hypothetical protein [Nocardia nova]|uniref:hypothetical protein n=1 Tax=Nocardia nova TaxID=37330 RepID=UPI0011B0C4B9|nr:hypothetical protein [Nocardia nova]